MPLHPLFVVEFYSPNEIVECRRSFNAENVGQARLATKHWLASEAEVHASRCRIIGQDGKTILDEPLAEFL